MFPPQGILLLHRPQSRATVTNASPAGLGLIFHTRNGTALNLNNLRFQDFWPTIKRAKLPRVRIHDLRHFHASLLLANGVDLPAVSGRLGHASKSFTLATYGHEMAGGQEQAATIANQLLPKLGESRNGRPTREGA